MNVNVKEYMEREFELLQKRVQDVAKAYEHQDPTKTMAESLQMFDAFKRFFALEDFIFSKLRTNAAMQPVIKCFLDERREIREMLEDLLMLHVSEPDFMKGIHHVVEHSKKHLDFVHKELHPKVVDALSPEDWTYLNESFDDRLHKVPF